MTWTALLGQWIEFARSALALPDDSDGRAMKQSVADIITLQAVWFALRDIDTLPHDEKQLGLDRSELLIKKHESALRRRWQDSMPAKLEELICDVRHVLASAQKPHE